MVNEAIIKLLDGQNKMNEGTLIRYFDERDFNMQNYQVDHLKIS